MRGVLKLKKIIIPLLLTLMLTSLAYSISFISITSDKPSYHCGFDVKPGEYACEPVTLTINSMFAKKGVSLVMPYDYKDGEISRVKWNGKFFKSHFAPPFFNETKEVNLSSFDLMPGTTNITLTPIAYGDFKWNATLYDKHGNELATLDPWFNTSFQYRHELNLTSSSDTLTDFQVKIILNYSNINYSNTNDDGSDLRFTWFNQSSGNEQEIPYWIEKWNESDNSIVWIKAPMINNTDNNTYYYYYGNTTAVNTTSNGYTTFLFFEGFENGLSQWSEHLDGGTIEQSNTHTYTGDYSCYLYHSSGDYWDTYIEKSGLSFTNVVVESRMYIINDDDQVVLEADDSGHNHEAFVGDSGGHTEWWYRYDSTAYLSGISKTTGWHLMKIIIKSSSPYTQTGVDENIFSKTSDNFNVLGRIRSGGYWETYGLNIWVDNIHVRKYSSSNIGQSFSPEENVLRITSPANNSVVFAQNVNLSFYSGNINEDHNIYVDGVLNETVNVTSSPWNESFNFTAGYHNFTVTRASDESFNDSVSFYAWLYNITMISPENNSNISRYNVPLSFNTDYLNENHSIYVDGLLNETVNVTSSPWNESFNFTAGYHNFTVTRASDETFNDSVNFSCFNTTINIVKPAENANIFTQSIELSFTTNTLNTTYNIYVDGGLNRVVNVTASPWNESFSLATGNHMIIVALKVDEKVNDSVSFSVFSNIGGSGGGGGGGGSAIVLCPSGTVWNPNLAACVISSIKVEPIQLNETLFPGQKKIEVFKVTNLKESKTEIELKPDQTWIYVDKASRMLDAGATEEFQVVVSAPFKGGSYSGVIGVYADGVKGANVPVNIHVNKESSMQVLIGILFGKDYAKSVNNFMSKPLFNIGDRVIYVATLIIIILALASVVLYKRKFPMESYVLALTTLVLFFMFKNLII